MVDRPDVPIDDLWKCTGDARRESSRGEVVEDWRLEDDDVRRELLFLQDVWPRWTLWLVGSCGPEQINTLEPAGVFARGPRASPHPSWILSHEWHCDEGAIGRAKYSPPPTHWGWWVARLRRKLPRQAPN
ncbi:hypothetical protein GGTG_01308 [Gaeumannomyces tritici R3-111a-1]|uniref:Uncharacterized protein n=1 Tax=Gaeumannomyces tritici (strain R3-111a-1) TaxID=644352 RepID=J3NJ74_GAET3|nr:hypothetical protein GGTG_01308 [Gaeumannomyces tritici R3-111a-1]EJT81325.1 hypothetical protein GGTG_01308 [Gaeumannomyces tritici R3-111a-1]